MLAYTYMCTHVCGVCTYMYVYAYTHVCTYACFMTITIYIYIYRIYAIPVTVIYRSLPLTVAALGQLLTCGADDLGKAMTDLVLPQLDKLVFDR
jgi:hypothetical protein